MERHAQRLHSLLAGHPTHVPPERDDPVSWEKSRISRRAGGAHHPARAIPTAASAASGAASARCLCPVACIALQATEDEHGRRYPELFRINFSRCIFCGFCEDACPTYAIQLTPDFEMSEYTRPNLVYEKEDLLIDGEGKYPGYNYYRVAGVAIGGKGKGEAEREAPPADVRTVLP